MERCGTKRTWPNVRYWECDILTVANKQKLQSEYATFEVSIEIQQVSQ